MSTPQGTPVKHVKLGLVSAKSMPLTNEYKKLLGDQHHRLTLKHQQDLDLLDDIRGYVKARLSIEKDYTNALQKLAKHHSNHISKKFFLFNQLEQEQGNEGQQKGDGLTKPAPDQKGSSSSAGQLEQPSSQSNNDSAYDGQKAHSLYRVWREHIVRLQSSSKNRSDQFEQLIMIVDKLKDIRQHKASIGKKCLDNHLRRIHEELLLTMTDVERTKKLYYEDESQARKARENEERIKKKRTGLLTKFTDLQAKKEKSSAQREATDIQSTQARNDYIMALAAANAHLKQYYHRDLNDFIHLVDDGVLDQCKIFMATLSECDINSLKDALQHAQYWSKMINATSSQQTNSIFLECEQSKCLRTKQELAFEPCNNDPIQKISLEHNADYALQHEIDKWFTWFKKECRNLSQLMHQLDTCQHAYAEGKKSIEVNGQAVEDLEPKIIELKQQIRKCEAAKLKAQARLRAIKEGGMQIEEWSDVELEIRADMARAQEEQQRAQRLKELKELKEKSVDNSAMDQDTGAATDDDASSAGRGGGGGAPVRLQILRDSDEEETPVGGPGSMHNLASVSRSTSNLMQKQQDAMTGYSNLTDPSLIWQDDYSSAWGGGAGTPSGARQDNTVVSNSFTEQQQQQQPSTTIKSPTSPQPPGDDQAEKPVGLQQLPNANMSIQSSSPLSAIVNGGQHLSQSPYQVGIISEAYKSDYECDYARTGHLASVRSAASSAEPNTLRNRQLVAGDSPPEFQQPRQADEASFEQQQRDVANLLNQRVIALYTFEKNNEDDLAFNEDDVLVVVETNPEDTNWVKARLESTGEEGFIPSTYVRLLAEDDGDERQTDSADQADAWQSLDQQQSTVVDESDRQAGGSDVAYCRAMYDYKPEENTFEEDGLPHLSLEQGEVMRIVDCGADDGWWLVEKEQTGTRGHVPSMLVVEFDPNDDDDAEDDEGLDDEFDDGDVTEREVEGEDEMGAKPPPSFEAPVLDAAAAAAVDNDVLVTDNQADVEESEPEKQQEPDAEPERPAAKEAAEDAKSDSLIPTSFIIIEPTPEVESRRFEDNLADGEAGSEANKADVVAGNQDVQNAQDSNSGAGEANNDSVRQVIHSKQPSSQVSYSVVNEDFVLEKPTRKPYQHSAGSLDNPAAGQHHEPTIEEVDDRLERDEEAKLTESETAGQQLMDDELGDKMEPNYTDMPAPPAVVIDSVEAIPRSPDLSFDEGGSDEDRAADGEAEGDQQPGGAGPEQVATRPIKHTGFVDVSPILRHHADEFCKQLIEEAIMLAPGSRIGPSTSSASVDEQLSAKDVDRKPNEADEEEDSGQNYSCDDSL